MAKAKVTVDPIIEKAIAEHNDCAALTVGGKLFVFKPLSLDEFEDFQARSAGKNAPPGPLNRECCQTALVHPDLTALQEAFERAPGFATMAATAIMQMSISGVEIVVKKG